MFDEQDFPYEYECDACGRTTTIEHEDVQDVPSYVRASAAVKAAEHVIKNRRAWALRSAGPLCPDCIDGRY